MGDPAVRFQWGANTEEEEHFEIRTFGGIGSQVEINLIQSHSFYFGLKTSMGFTPFRDLCYFPKRPFYYDFQKVKLTLIDDREGYRFSLQSDKFTEPKVLEYSFRGREALLNDPDTFWASSDSRLPVSKPEDFSHNI